VSEQRSYLLAVILVALVFVAGAVLSPSQTVPIIGFGTLIAAALLQLLQGSKAAVKVAEVAEVQKTDAKKIDKLAVVAQATHALVNSQYGAALLATVLALKNVARLTTDPADKARAEAAVDEAERLYKDHQRKQAMVDDDDPWLKGGS
jgi:hypothetical protein